MEWMGCMRFKGACSLSVKGCSLQLSSVKSPFFQERWWFMARFLWVFFLVGLAGCGGGKSMSQPPAAAQSLASMRRSWAMQTLAKFAKC
jgi:hypothetical protein